MTAGARWQVDGGQFQSSGATVAGLSVGTNNHIVTFNTISGWTTPPSKLVSVRQFNRHGKRRLCRDTAPGSLQVTIAPATAAAAGALWQVDGGTFESSAAKVDGLSVGKHTITFNSVGGWTTPAAQNVSIISKQTTKATGTYSCCAKGIYNGLFYTATGVTEETAGMLRGLNLGPLGTYSAIVLIGGRSFGISGGFNVFGQTFTNLPRLASLGGPLEVFELQDPQRAGSEVILTCL